ncbi:K02A2.6-like, partial [Cordylochernes scorpioides]
MFQTNGLRLARSLINVVNKETYIWITNPYPRPLKILKNQTLCFGSQPAEVNLIEESEQKEHEEPQFQIIENLSYKEKEQLKQVLEKYADLFSLGLGRSKLAKHRIDTEGAKPIKHKQYRVSAKEREIIKEQIDEMLRDGIIRPSSSPWSFPVILVKKRDGKYRFCVDHRKLNNVTVKDVYPIPRIDEVLDTLQGSKYFSAIDLKSGYWQVEVEEKDKEKTAFTTAHGLYEFNVMPFGLCNAPATFERNMENMLGNLRWQICLCYLDDVIIYSSDFSTHLKRKKAVLRCFREANLKLNNKKCQFAFEELEILGHITNQHGIKPAEHNIKAIRDFPWPKKIKEVQSFLGICSYYRKFIKGFSKIADPLTSLIKKNVPFTWTENQEKAFQTLKVALINPPILGHFDPNAITYIHTDASNIGLGATLVQKFGDKEMVISYLSRTLSKPEQNYSTTEKECLAVVWSMSKLRPYLYGRHFKIVIDHALCWLKNLKDPTGRLARWQLKIQEYNFEIIHKSGKKHLDADANYPFERIGIDFVGPLPSTKRRRKWIIVLTDYYTKYAETKAVSEATVKEVSTFLIEHIILRHGAPRFLISDRGSQFTSNLMKEVMKMCKVKHCFTTSYHPQTNGLTERLNRTLVNMISMYVNTDQKNWDEILPFITHAYNTTIQETTGYSPFFLLFGREPMSLLDDENIPTDSNMDDYDEYIENYLDKIARTRQVVINNTEKTQERMKRNYDKKHNEKIYEAGYLVAVWTPVRKIGKCEKLLRKYFGPYRILKKLSNVNYLIEPKDNPGQDPLIVHVSRLNPYFERIDEPIPVPRAAFEKIGMDLLGRFSTSTCGIHWIIVCIDYLTKYAITKAIPTIEDVILKHSALRELITDRRRNITSSLIRDLNKHCRIIHRTTTAYHPQTNGLTERLNKTMADMLSILDVTYEFRHSETSKVIVKQKTLFTLDLENDSPSVQEEDIPTERTQHPQTREEISGPITRSRALRLRMMKMEINPGASTTKGNDKPREKKLTTNEATRHTLATKHANVPHNTRNTHAKRQQQRQTSACTTVKNNTIIPSTQNIEKIHATKQPHNRKTLRSFLKAVNVFKEFIPDHARLRTPLINLLKKDIMWVWDDECQKAFTNLKENLTTHPTLHLYQEGLPCQVYCNTSTFSITGVLKQVYPDGKTYTVQHFSRSLRSHERNYSDLELQCLAIVESVDNFRTCLNGRKFTIFSDHPALQWLKEIKAPSGRLFRWRLRLSRYEYE